MKAVTYLRQFLSLKSLSLIIGGSLVYSIGFNMFILPCNLYNGGFLGIAQLLGYFMRNVLGLSFVTDNYIGIIGFDSDVREYLPIDQFSLTQKTLYKGAVNSLDANGNTAMYNGLCVAMDRIYKKSQELGGNCTPIIFVLTDGDSNTGYKFSDTKDIIAGMNIPIYTISYNYAADSLSELASINEAASIVGNSEDITYKLRNLFNAEM